jgi:predicted nucleic acid-binding protein
MQHIVDASVVAKWFLPEPHKQQAEKLLRGFLDETVELAAPDLLVAEVGNLLWRRSVLIGDISIANAAESYRNFLALDIPLHSSGTIAAAALKIATDERRRIYDMIYVALAQQNACELITADETLLNALGKKFSCLRWIGDV